MEEQSAYNTVIQAHQEQNVFLELSHKLQRKAFIVYEVFLDLVTLTANIKRFTKIDKYFDWLLVKTEKIKEEPNYNPALIGILKRGQIVHINLGFNIGQEFGGEHYAIVLRDCNKMDLKVLVLPITSKEPKNKQLPIYVDLGITQGLAKNHWANILNVQNISKQRITERVENTSVDGRILNKISDRIIEEIAIRKIDKSYQTRIK